MQGEVAGETICAVFIYTSDLRAGWLLVISKGNKVRLHEIHGLKVEERRQNIWLIE